MKRRDFLRSSFLIAGGLTLTHPFKALASLGTKQDTKGKVTTNGVPLANVVVSDGYSVVTTNQKGEYILPFDEQAEFVFISTPSGYEFKQENNVAGTFDRLKQAEVYDFELIKMQHNDHHHKFIVWADPQIKDTKDAAQLLNSAAPDVYNLVKSFDPTIPVHGLAVGDLIWDEHKRWKDYKQAVKQMGIPFYQAIGNHDSDQDNGGDKGSDQTFKMYFGPTYYSFNRGQAHYVMLDDVRFTGPGKTYDGYITEVQLAWLAQDLSFVDPDTLIIIGLHIPVHSAVKNRAVLYQILERFKNVHIMSGHTHTNRNVITNNVFEHVHGTVCGAFWTGPLCVDGTPRGYGVYDVVGNNLEWYYKSTTKPADYQISVSIAKLDKGRNRVTANVWNYDPSWKVELMVDGVKVADMEKVTAMDPLTVKMYEGDKMPADRRAWVEPKKNDHMFIGHLDNSAKKITVLATDRFGKQFSATI